MGEGWRREAPGARRGWHTCYPIDATLVLVAHSGDRILTSDLQDS